MVISQFTEDRPSFLSALIYLVFRTTTCHMDYFYSPDAERHREVKLLKVTNSAERWGSGGWGWRGRSPNRPLDSSAQQECSSPHPLRKEELIPQLLLVLPDPAPPPSQLGLLTPEPYSHPSPLSQLPVLLLRQQRQELPGSLFSFLGYEHRFPTWPLPSRVPPDLLPAPSSGQGGS